MTSSQQTENLFDSALQKLFDHRFRVHRSHEAFLDYGLFTMRAQREAILLKMALCSREGIEGFRTVNRHSPAEKGWPPPPSVDPTERTPSPRFNEQHIAEFATGSLVRCFGQHYAIYEGKRSPRTPNGDLQLLSRVIDVQGTRGDFSKGASLTAEYDVPADAWFYRNNACPVMPYSIFMEIALQPCGFLATFMGCTLIYPGLELCFRNLDSTATLSRETDLRNRTVRAKSVLTSVASSAETVIVQFDYELSLDGVPFYHGDTGFGYFTPNALANQVGLDRGEMVPPWFQQNSRSTSEATFIDLRKDADKRRYLAPQPDKPFYFQPDGQLNFLDKLWIFDNSGKYGLGYIYAEKEVDPTDWFYPCHFYQDPVMPGSLGVESILESMRIFAINQRLEKGTSSPYFTSALGTVVWKYRGQIVQTNRKMVIESHIKKIERQSDRLVITADASLWKDGLRIYEITDAAIAIADMS